MKLKSLLFISAAALSFAACNQTKEAESPVLKSGLDAAKFETTVDEVPVKLYTLTNADGMEVSITNYGARIVTVMAKDKDGNYQDVVLGFDNIDDYMNADGQHDSNFGAAIGRYGNRINQGKITVDGKEYQLPQNNYGHCLHGGPEGYHYQVFNVVEATDSKLVLQRVDPDGFANFPGNLDVTITYTLTEDNGLDIQYEATTDAETVCNLTNHTYFNLSGNPAENNHEHVLYINADNFTPVDATFMTTGEILPVADSQFDFLQPRALKECIGDSLEGKYPEQIKNGFGIDHNFVLNTYKDGVGDETVVAASLYSPASGIFMEMYTNEPGVQVYTGNFLDGELAGKGGIKYPKQASVCLETQKYPDSPNKKDWPQPYLKPGEKYYSHTVYKFSVK